MKTPEMVLFYEKLSESYFNEPYGMAFSEKTGRRVKFFDIRKDHFLLSILTERLDAMNYLSEYKYVYVVPLDLPDGFITGFNLKPLNDKHFLKIGLYDGFPYFFGFQDFGDFKYGDKVFLVEGMKDCLAVKKLYKYVIAYLKLTPNDDFVKFLKTLTNKIIMIPDDDDAGRSIVRNKKYTHFKKYFIRKDCGEYYDGKKDILDKIRNVMSCEGIKA
jgi:5S rRNA maturation endonuclease (ribonuclease M5)